MNETELREMLEDMSVVAWEVAGPPADARTILRYHETPTYWICPGEDDRVGIMVTLGDQAWTFASDIPLWLANYLATFNPHAMMELTNHFLKEDVVPACPVVYPGDEE